jgi:hypothetical protein
MEIVAPKDPMSIKGVYYETLFQKAENVPFYDYERFWLQPKYLQSKWAFPINVSNTDGDIFSKDSNINGLWMKVTVELIGGVKTFIRNIMTIFTTSNT